MGMRKIKFEDGSELSLSEKKYNELLGMKEKELIDINLVDCDNTEIYLKSGDYQMWWDKGFRVTESSLMGRQCYWQDVKPNEIKVGDVVRHYNNSDNKNYYKYKLVVEIKEGLIVYQYFNNEGYVDWGCWSPDHWEYNQKAVRYEK